MQYKIRYEIRKDRNRSDTDKTGARAASHYLSLKILGDVVDIFSHPCFKDKEFSDFNYHYLKPIKKQNHQQVVTTKQYFRQE